MALSEETESNGENKPAPKGREGHFYSTKENKAWASNGGRSNTQNHRPFTGGAERSPDLMSRIPPNKRISQAISEFLKSGVDGSQDVKSTLFLLGAQRLVQELLEEEATDFLGRDYYERRSEDQDGSRNGYKKRSIKTAEGKIPVYQPQVRDAEEPYRSRLWQFLKGNSDVLQYLVAEMYARGLSTRDIEDTFTDSSGECLISKSAVSQVTDTLWDEYLTFSQRDLSDFTVIYLFLDAVYEPMRLFKSPKEGILCAWGILATGEKVLLHMDLGNKESYRCWLDFLRNMVQRGLPAPLSITTDGAPGLTKAVEEMWPFSCRIRCWFHKMQNVLDKVPESHKQEVKAFLTTVRDAVDYENGKQRAEEFAERYNALYPRAVNSLYDDLEATLNHLKMPVIHRKYIRTTNLIERSFGEEKRRSKVIPRYFDEKSALKLAYATLWRASQRWRRVRFTEVEQKMIAELRIKMGLEEQIAENEDEGKNNDDSAA